MYKILADFNFMPRICLRKWKDIMNHEIPVPFSLEVNHWFI